MNIAVLAALLVALSAPSVIGSSVLQAPAVLAAGAGAELAAAPGRDQHDRWVDRILAARRNVEQARRDEARARIDYGRMRNHGKLRGSKRKEITEARDRVHQVRIDAERALEVLLDKARRERVPPGWVREAMEGFQQSPAALAN